MRHRPEGLVLLWRSMERVAALPDAERERLAGLPAPAPEGTGRRRALALRLAGAPFADIAGALGVPCSTAATWVYEEVERTRGEEVRHADAARHFHVEQLRRLQRPHWPKAVAGDARAAEVVLKLMDREARLLNLYAPAGVDVGPRVAELARETGISEDELRAELAAVVAALPVTSR